MRVRKSSLLLPIMWVALLPHPLLTQASGQQYRESNLDFVRSLSARLNVAETRATELEAQVDAISTQQASGHVQLQQAPLASGSKSKPSSASTAPPPDDGALMRVSERLRHKERAVDGNPDDLARIKVKFPWLREQIANARKNLLSHELTHVEQSVGRKPARPGLKEIETAIIEIETRLASLAAEIETAKKQPDRQ